MSIRYQAKVVMGFLLEERKTPTKITKYNPDTGEPYQADGPPNVTYWVQDKQVFTDLSFPDGLWEYMAGHGDKIEGMEVFTPGYGGTENDTQVLGQKVALVDDDHDYTTFCTFEPTPVKQFSNKHNIQADPYLILQCG